MRLSGIDHLADLYEAARNSAVPIRKTMLPQETQAAQMATQAILKRRASESATVTAHGQWLVVSDAGPFISLAMADRLDLLTTGKRKDDKIKSRGAAPGRSGYESDHNGSRT
jgi:hypothetical protein